MKKKLQHQLLTVVKYSFVGVFLQCLITCVLLASPGITRSQHISIEEIYVPVNPGKIKIKEAFALLEQFSSLEFVYLNNAAIGGGYVELKGSQKSLGDILRDISRAKKLAFKRVNDKIYVKRIDDGKTSPARMVQEVLEIEISGKVTDENGEPLPGASVVVKGSGVGTVTDAEGLYKLNVPDNATTLVFSFVGYLTEETDINGRTIIDVNLSPDISQLSEVVVIGYGTQQKRDLTGAIASVDMEGKANATNTNIAQALQGYLPGVNVGISANAGDEPDINIRGRTSLSGSDNPLIVLDGIIYNGNLSDININDVESIDVLKDASAAAVYGSRSANGVVLITTKMGKTGKPQISFNAYGGVQDLSPSDRTNIMNGEQFMTRLVDYDYQSQVLAEWYRSNPTDPSGRPPRPDPTDPNVVFGSARSVEEYDNWLAGNEINWLDEVLRPTSKIQSYDLSVSGKTDKSSYYVSGSYINQEGVTIGDQFKRATIRANFDTKVVDWLTFGLNSSYAFIDKSGVPTDIGEALQGSPWANKYEPDGISYPIDLAGESYQRHPLSNTIGDHDDLRNNIFLASRLVFDIPWVKGLKYEINGSYSYFNRRDFQFYPAKALDGSSQNGLAERLHVYNSSWIINNLITYSRTFADIHRLNVTLLGSRENRSFSSSKLTGKDFSIPSLGYEGIGLANIQNVSSTAEEENNIAYMGRVNYTLNNKYLFTGTLRRDGFSGFAEGNKTALFPSASFGWLLSEESFLSGTDWIDFLKFRISYGKNGNQDVGRFGSIARAQTSFYVYGPDTYVGYHPSSLGNQGLTWETTTSTNFGLDYSFINDRISGTLDIYTAKTEDVLVERSLPRISGFQTILENIGEVENKGVEIGLTTMNIQSEGFRWETVFTFALNRNKLVKLYGGEQDFDIGNSWFTGEPINTHYGFNNLGVVWTEEEFFNGEVPEGFFPGYFKVEDVMTSEGNDQYHPDDDRKILGSSDPNYRFSMLNTFSYKNFTLSIFLNAIQGGNDYYLSDATGLLVAGGTDFSRRNNRTAVRPYWRPDAPTTDSPGMYWPQQNAGPLLVDRSFVRLQDISLTYNLPQSALNTIGFSNMQIYLSSKNLATWTKWPGWDPEVVGRRNPEDLTQTQDNVPIMRSFILGINASF